MSLHMYLDHSRINLLRSPGAVTLLQEEGGACADHVALKSRRHITPAALQQLSQTRLPDKSASVQEEPLVERLCWTTREALAC